jgi:hypothetical protein
MREKSAKGEYAFIDALIDVLVNAIQGRVACSSSIIVPNADTCWRAPNSAGRRHARVVCARIRGSIAAARAARARKKSATGKSGAIAVRNFSLHSHNIETRLGRGFERFLTCPEAVLRQKGGWKWSFTTWPETDLPGK